MNIVIGYDGSHGAREAVMDLQHAGVPCDTNARVVCLADVWPALPLSAYEKPGEDPDWQKSPMLRRAQGLAAEAVARAKASADEGAAFVRTQFPGWKVTHAHHTGNPSLGLIEPDQIKPDLIVVGSHSKSALERFVLGSVSQNVLNHATTSVRISRAHHNRAENGDSPIRIVLGVDGSAYSELAVRTVTQRHWPAGTQVKVVAALDLKFWSVLVNPGSSAWTWSSESMTEGKSWATRAVEAVAAELRLAGLTAIAQTTEGDPKHVLVDEAKRWDAHSIFVGAKGHTGLERFLLGSVSAAVAARAHCSVEIVRQGEEHHQ